jgi:hypothetical protein
VLCVPRLIRLAALTSVAATLDGDDENSTGALPTTWTRYIGFTLEIGDHEQLRFLIDSSISANYYWCLRTTGRGEFSGNFIGNKVSKRTLLLSLGSCLTHVVVVVKLQAKRPCDHP